MHAVRYGGGTFPFRDGAFDVCWSNAVLEHVGGEDAQVAFLKEIRRVARRGFVTTPNRCFPVEVHTRVPLLHLVLSRPRFDAFLRRIGKGWAAGDYMRLLTEADLRRLLRRAGVPRFRILRNRLGPFTLDFVAVW